MRQIINKNQKSFNQYFDYNGRPLQFNKVHGYKFSDDPEMDDCVNYFLSLKGFELVSEKKKEQPKVTPKKEEKKPEIKPKVISKKDKKEEKVVQEVKKETKEK